jgi:hypothetical protein
MKPYQEICRAHSVGARHTTGARIGRGETYSDFKMSPLHHRTAEHTKKKLKQETETSHSERPGSALPPRLERSLEVGKPATAPAEGMRTLAAW